MTATEQIKTMMADAYDRYQRSMTDDSDPNKHRASFYKGRYEAFRESLNTLENENTQTNSKLQPDS